MPRVELITRGERRRVWTLEQKREIVVESLGPALTPTEVARKYAISSGLLYGWRQKLLAGQMTILQRSRRHRLAGPTRSLHCQPRRPRLRFPHNRRA